MILTKTQKTVLWFMLQGYELSTTHRLDRADCIEIDIPGKSRRLRQSTLDALVDLKFVRVGRLTRYRWSSLQRWKLTARGDRFARTITL